MTTPGGWRMSVAMTNCGDAGWLSDASGYRYDAIDPETRRPWPAMPDVFAALAARAAGAAGFDRFVPDACLVNRYEPGARLTLHQDRDEQDFGAPIVSVSLGRAGIVPLGRRHALAAGRGGCASSMATSSSGAARPASTSTASTRCAKAITR